MQETDIKKSLERLETILAEDLTPDQFYEKLFEIPFGLISWMARDAQTRVSSDLAKGILDSVSKTDPRKVDVIQACLMALSAVLYDLKDKDGDSLH